MSYSCFGIYLVNHQNLTKVATLAENSALAFVACRESSGQFKTNCQLQIQIQRQYKHKTSTNTTQYKYNTIQIKLLECPIPPPPPLSVSQKIRVTSLLAVFHKHGHMDFSKTSNSISHHLTSIFPENCQICWVGRVGGLGYLRGSRGLSARRARRTKSRPEGPPTRSRGPEGP